MRGLRIRVTLDGKAPQRELMADHMKLSDLSRDDVADLIRDALEAICSDRDWHPVKGLTLSRVAAIEFSMQAISSLRW